MIKSYLLHNLLTITTVKSCEPLQTNLNLFYLIDVDFEICLERLHSGSVCAQGVTDYNYNISNQEEQDTVSQEPVNQF